MKRYLQVLWEKAEKANERNILSILEYNSNAVLLDCGCGGGELTLKFAKKIGTRNKIGIEIVDDLIYKAKQNGINVIKADLNGEFPFDTDTIDVVIANQVIEHLPKVSEVEVMEFFNKILKPNGMIIMSTMADHIFNFIDPACLFGYRHYN